MTTNDPEELKNNDVLEEEKWMRIRKLYDAVDLTRRSRGSCKKEELTPTEVKERESKKLGTPDNQNKLYQLSVVEELTWYYEGTTRLNYRCSNEHIAHIVLRCHERQFEWRKIPFKPRSYIYNDVWTAMCMKVVEMKNKISDEWELFERYNDGT